MTTIQLSSLNKKNKIYSFLLSSDRNTILIIIIDLISLKSVTTFWRTGNAAETRRLVFPQLFRFLPRLHWCFYNLFKTHTPKMVSYSSEKKGKSLLHFGYKKRKFSLPAPSLRQDSIPDELFFVAPLLINIAVHQQVLFVIN